MDPLQSLNGVLQEYQKLDRNKGIKRSENVQSSQNANSVKESNVASESAKDTFVISADSKTMLEKEKEVSQYVQELETMKSIDDEQLKQIKNRLESGYYRSPAVMEKVMHDLLVSSPIPVHDIFEVSAQEETTPATEMSPLSNEANLAAIREKIENKDYSSDAVMNVVANKMLGIE
ncbi:MAG: hypothetical protein KAI81_02895 [Candidatus Marinimicrobia bacterium]|nr:hypothetical protein [Candidatus Neomarinimicrobiota bacterium]